MQNVILVLATVLATINGVGVGSFGIDRSREMI